MSCGEPYRGDCCNADPVNCEDLGGTFSLTGLLSAVVVVGEIASLIPGPVGAAAAGISAVAYAVQGNTAKAIEMGVTAAAALVGAGAVVRVAARAVGSAAKAGQAVARAAPKVMRTAGQKIGAMIRRSGSCALPNSFVAGTLVVLADGSLAPIEDLVRGDVVRTTDPVTGETSDQPVIATITATGTKHLIAVVTDATAFTATAGHPIWVQAQGWTDAADLEVGDQLTGSGGQVHTITEVTDLGPLANQDVYNLTVSTTHTYYVSGEEASLNLLVHNCGASRLTPGNRLGTILERAPIIGSRSRLFGKNSLGAPAPGLLNNRNRVVRYGWSVAGDGVKGGQCGVTLRRFDTQTSTHRDYLFGRILN